MTNNVRSKPSTISVLLVEDNSGDVLLIKRMLRKQQNARYELESVHSIEDGSRLLSERAFDVVLLDLGLTDSKGIETLIELRTRHPNVPIVILTGQDDIELSTESIQKGAQDFLVKDTFDGYWLHRIVQHAIQRKELEHELNILAKFPDKNPNAVLRVAEDGTLLYANEASKQLLALCDCQVGGLVRKNWLTWLQSAKEEKQSHTHEQQLDSLHFRFQVVPLESGQFYLYVEEITKEKQAALALQHTARHDALTNIPNRMYFMQILKQTLARAERHTPLPFAVMYLDLNRFKQVNDKLGHAIGDILLVQFSERLKECTRSGDVVARLGGDEFVILLRDMRGPIDAIRVAKRIQQSLKTTPFQLEKHTLFAQTSIGIALSEQAYKHPEDYLKDADIAMYRAKKCDFTEYAIFDERMHTEATERIQLETTLQESIKNQSFTLHFQPIVDSPRGEVVGYEALVRWKHPEQGLLFPDAFLPLAEASDLIVPLGWWVFEAACKQFSEWQRSLASPLSIHINICGKQLLATNVLTTITQLSLQCQLPPERIVLEICEAPLLQYPEEIIMSLQLLKERGFTIYIDNFGEGDTAIGRLQQLPIDGVKLARSLVMDMMTNTQHKALAQSILALAGYLGLDLIAVGVENQEHFETLRGWGCKKMQGHLFSEPVPANECKHSLEKQATKPRT